MKSHGDKVLQLERCLVRGIGEGCERLVHLLDETRAYGGGSRRRHGCGSPSDSYRS
jgi:hypothetical protein